MRRRILRGVVLLMGVIAWTLFAAPREARSAEGSKHTVILGDNLHLLSAYYFRDPRRFRDIRAANRKEVGRDGMLRPGSTLVIPPDGLRTVPLPYAEWRKQALR